MRQIKSQKMREPGRMCARLAAFAAACFWMAGEARSEAGEPEAAEAPPCTAPECPAEKLPPCDDSGCSAESATLPGGSRAGEAEPAIEDVTISAGNVLAVVSPDRGGRVMDLRFGGENLLWVNHRPDILQWGWKNHGGEKTWIGPQEKWEAIGGRAWPPPEFDEGAYEITGRSAASVSMLSKPDASCGFRVSRKVEAFPGRLVVTSALLPAADDGESLGIRITNWAVAQLPPPPRIGARLAGRKRIANGIDGKDGLPDPDRISDGAAVFRLGQAAKGGKCGLDGDMFLVEVEGGLLSIRQLGDFPADDSPDSPDRGQLYFAARENLPEGYTPYIEVEFAKPANGGPQSIEYRFIPAPPGADSESLMQELLGRPVASEKSNSKK